MKKTFLEKPRPMRSLSYTAEQKKHDICSAALQYLEKHLKSLVLRLYVFALSFKTR